MNEQEVLDAAKLLKKYCSAIHCELPKTEKYKGGYVCDYCCLAEKLGKNNKPICLLHDDFNRHTPQFWKIDDVKIEEKELSLF